MPEHKCKDCGAIWYGWAKQDICQKCGGKLEPVPENNATESRVVGRSCIK